MRKTYCCLCMSFSSPVILSALMAKQTIPKTIANTILVGSTSHNLRFAIKTRIVVAKLGETTNMPIYRANIMFSSSFTTKHISKVSTPITSVMSDRMSACLRACVLVKNRNSSWFSLLFKISVHAENSSALTVPSCFWDILDDCLTILCSFTFRSNWTAFKLASSYLRDSCLTCWLAFFETLCFFKILLNDIRP